MRTSSTHPIYIDMIPFVNGRVGISFAPGKRGPSWNGAPWARDFDTDLRAIQQSGAGTLITALTAAEMRDLSISNLGSAAAGLGMRWIHLPLPDGSAPDRAWFTRWAEVAPEMHRRLEAGETLVFHCRGGLERAPMMVALLMMERGIELSAALERIARSREGATPLPAQIQALRDTMPSLTGEARLLRDVMRAGALGDALGAELEFLDLTYIQDLFPRSVDILLPHQGHTGAVTDDTQMSLFTAEGLAAARQRAQERGLSDPAGMIRLSLMKWLATQDAPEILTEGIAADPRLQVRRAPGNTCLSALRQATSYDGPAQNNSKGCGTIMRVAPVAFAGLSDPIAIARATSALTHGHPAGIEAAAAFVHILRAVSGGVPLDEAARHAGRMALSGEVSCAIDRALSAPRDGAPATVATLGQGWIAEEALSIALYAALCAKSLDHGLSIALKHSGDSDSTGAIAGNLLAVVFQSEVMNHPLIESVECADLIEKAVRSLYPEFSK